MQDIFELIEQGGILPELTIEDAIDAIAIGQAISEGGIPIAEVTFRTAEAENAIRLMSSAIPDMMIGAGTVLTTEQAQQAIDAGAKFIVSPGINAEVVNYCREKGVPMIPGVCTPSDIENAIRLGLRMVKFFPAEANGGIEGIRAISAPYPNMNFLASGGIDESTVESYLHSRRVVAVAGNWMASNEMIKARDFETVKKKCAEAVRMLLGLEIDHIGVAFAKDEEARMAAEDVGKLFAADINEKPLGYFAGDFFEAVRPGGQGTNGFIAIKTNHIGRAINYFELRGAVFNKNSIEYSESGDIKSIYMDREWQGIGLKLIQKEYR